MNEVRRLRAFLGLAALLLPATAPNAARADLVFSQPTIDAGEVYSGPVLARRFAFVNRGPDAVEVTDLRAGCGCLKPRLDRRTYQPGEAGELLVEINTLTQAPGAHAWPVLVCYRSGTTAHELPLRLTARLVTEVTVQPAALTVTTDAALAHEVVLTDLRPRPLAVTGTTGSSPQLQARVVETGNDEAGHRTYKVRIEVAADYPEGRSEAVVAIYTDDAAYRELCVPVTVVKRARAAVTATPGAVALRAAPGQPVPSRVVLLRDNTGGERVVVEEVSADDPAVSCRWAPGPDKLATLKVSVDRARVLQTVVRVRVSKPSPQTLTIPVTCTLAQ
jgi:hypothetical protein